MAATVTYLPLPAVAPEPDILTPPAHYTPAEQAAWLAGVEAGRDAEAAAFLAVTQRHIDGLSGGLRLRVVPNAG